MNQSDYAEALAEALRNLLPYALNERDAIFELAEDDDEEAQKNVADVEKAVNDAQEILRKWETGV